MEQNLNRQGKRHSIGFELEAFTIDSEGKLVNGLQKPNKTLLKKKIFTLEVAQSMVEFNAKPHQWSLGSLKNLLEKTALTQKTLDKQEFSLLTAGTYPGKSQPTVRTKKWYETQSAILGPTFSFYATRVCGFHLHFCLPKAALLPGNKSLRIYKNYDLRRKVLNIYNLLIAADPAISCLMQNSPFFESMHLGKDSRVIIYRNFKLPNVTGLYQNYPEFGALPEYEHTLTDVNHRSIERKKQWMIWEKKTTGKISSTTISANPFKFFWGPVRVNKIGTIEQRGMDSGLPQSILAAASGLNAILKRVYYGELVVKQSDEAINKPFSIKNNSILIPPFSYVFNRLQPSSAIKGLENPEVYKYCNAFNKLALTYQKSDGTNEFNKPFSKILLDRKTQSDHIIDFARKNGFKKGQEIDEDTACQIALKQANQFTQQSQKVLETAEKYPEFFK